MSDAELRLTCVRNKLRLPDTPHGRAILTHLWHCFAASGDAGAEKPVCRPNELSDGHDRVRECRRVGLRHAQDRLDLTPAHRAPIGRRG